MRTRAGTATVELRHLRYFVAVAEELHFGRAADRLGIAQPPLSRQIRGLESALGVRLLLRSQYGVQLTNAGKVFLEEALGTLMQSEHAMNRARRAGRGEVGRLSIGIAPTSETGIIPRIVSKLVSRQPEIQLELHSVPGPDQVAALHAGRIDVGFLLVPPGRNGQVVVEPLVRESLCAALPKRHQLATQRRLTAEAFAREPFIALPRRTSPLLHDAVRAFFDGLGLTPEMRHHASQLDACLALVAAGVGVSVLPAGSRDVCRDGVVYRPFTPDGPTVQVGMIYRKDDRSVLLRHFTTAAREAAGPNRRCDDSASGGRSAGIRRAG